MAHLNRIRSRCLNDGTLLHALHILLRRDPQNSLGLLHRAGQRPPQNGYSTLIHKKFMQFFNVRQFARVRRTVMDTTRAFQQSRQTCRVVEGDVRHGAESAFADGSGSAVGVVWTVAAKGVVMPLDVLSGKMEELRELAEEEFVK
jgi:hypothetical protein